MGVLTARLHGSITAITAMATVSVWSEFPDRSSLRSFSNATGQTLLLSSMYAPIATSNFDADFSMMRPVTLPHTTTNAPSTVGAMSCMPANAGISSTPSIRYHKPASVPSKHASISTPPGPILSGICDSYTPRLTQASSLSCILRAPLGNSKCALPCSSTHPHAYPCLNSPVIASHSFSHSRVSISMILQGFRFNNLSGRASNISPVLDSLALLHMWHGPMIAANNPKSDEHLAQKSSTTVVLLGWLGAEHRHLRKYVEWYTSRGMHAVSFIIPMKDLLSLDAVDRAEKHVDALTENLVNWINEDVKNGNDRQLIFHTFSNTGWLTYGAVLEKLITHGDDFKEKIKGCVVDSAPSPKPDPQVWASGFSAALLKKNSVATRKLQSDMESSNILVKPSLTETALRTMLEKFFSVLFQVPYVNRRLNDVVTVLSQQQPSCPQLYIYSNADVVIPAKSVESFILKQKKSGRMVSACNFEHSPHVDHFRTYPEEYSKQLAGFLKVCMPQWAIESELPAMQLNTISKGLVV